MEEQEKALDSALAQQHQIIAPLNIKEAELLLLLTERLYSLFKKFKFKPAEEASIKEHISYFCAYAFAEIEPNEEQKKMYDDCREEEVFDDYQENNLFDGGNEGGYDEHKEEIDKFLAKIFQQYGIELDPDELHDLKNATKEDLENMMANIILQALEEEMGMPGGQRKKQQKRSKKKTAKQLEQEKKAEERERKKAEQKKAEEELKSKTVRSLYLSLAKVLHPDSGGTKEEQNTKGELMKEVSVAYQENDLLTLLKLEMQWMGSAEKTASLSDEKLKIYNAVLGEQVDELQRNAYSHCMHMKYNSIRQYLHLSARDIPIFMKKEKEDLEKRIEDLQINLSEIVNKKTLLQFLKISESYRSFDSLFLDDDDDEMFTGFFDDDLF